MLRSMQKPIWIESLRYTWDKLAGAGCSYCVLALFYFFTSSSDPFRFVSYFGKLDLWLYIYAYGIACSVLIDLITWRVQSNKLGLKIILYIAAGYPVFFFMSGINKYSLFAGTVGACFSLIFYIGTKLSPKVISAVILPLLICLIVNLNFTIKTNWVDQQTASNYTANFEYFNGTHDVPIRLFSGQIMTYTVKVTDTNGGHYETSLINDRNETVKITDLNRNMKSLYVREDGLYRIRITGSELRGGIRVTWDSN